MKYLIFVSIVLISSCSTFSGQRPKKGDEGWDGIKMYKPIPEAKLFESADKSQVSYDSPSITDYLLISVDDYLELSALIDAGIIWNRKQFFDYIASSKKEASGP